MAMEEKTITFSLERETKNTIRYAEDSNGGQPPAIGTLYVQKWALGDDPPKSLTITLAGK